MAGPRGDDFKTDYLSHLTYTRTLIVHNYFEKAIYIQMALQILILSSTN